MERGEIRHTFSKLDAQSSRGATANAMRVGAYCIFYNDYKHYRASTFACVPNYLNGDAVEKIVDLDE